MAPTSKPCSRVESAMAIGSRETRVRRGGARRGGVERETVSGNEGQQPELSAGEAKEGGEVDSGDSRWRAIHIKQTPKKRRRSLARSQDGRPAFGSLRVFPATAHARTLHKSRVRTRTSSVSSTFSFQFLQTGVLVAALSLARQRSESCSSRLTRSPPRAGEVCSSLC